MERKRDVVFQGGFPLLRGVGDYDLVREICTGKLFRSVPRPEGIPDGYEEVEELEFGKEFRKFPVRDVDGLLLPKYWALQRLA